MKRSKRFTIRRVAVGLAVAAVFVPSAQAEPIGSYERQSQSTVEIPYLSHGVGISHVDFTTSSSSSQIGPGEIPYLSHGIGVDEQLWSGSDVVIAPDDMTLSRPTNAGSTVVAENSSFDVNPAAVGGFGLAFVLLAGGSALAIRHNRKTRLSPA
jgi:hypothetical protein